MARKTRAPRTRRGRDHEIVILPAEFIPMTPKRRKTIIAAMAELLGSVLERERRESLGTAQGRDGSEG